MDTSEPCEGAVGGVAGGTEIERLSGPDLFLTAAQSWSLLTSILSDTPGLDHDKDTGRSLTSSSGRSVRVTES